jgi:hypothetical protein
LPLQDLFINDGVKPQLTDFDYPIHLFKVATRSPDTPGKSI